MSFGLVGVVGFVVDGVGVCGRSTDYEFLRTQKIIFYLAVR